MKSKKIDEFFNKAISKMFQAVGFKDFDKEFASQESWYALKSWDQKTQEDFKTWFIKTCSKDLKWSKNTAEKEFSYFNLMYGWSLKTNNIDNP